MTDLNKLYNQYYNSARVELRKCGCNNTNFDDIYQDAFYELFARQLEEGNDRSYNQRYVTRMCKFKWYNERRKQKVYLVLDELMVFYVREEAESDEKIGLLMKHYKNLSASCKEILSLFVKGFSEKEMGDRLNLPNRDAVKNKKYNCKTKLHDMVVSDPLFEKLYGRKI